MAVMVDSHVHYHHCFHNTEFLNFALNNFKRYSPPSQDESVDLVLLFTESRGVDTFARLHSDSGSFFDNDEWQTVSTSENCSIRLRNRSGDEIVVIAGRQIVTLEKLEVLALGVVAEIPDGASLEGSVASVRECGGIPVLPWGFGKWIGRRGEIVDKYISRLKSSDGVFLGDNGNRLSLISPPTLFSRARENGVFTLPGSDPLPFVKQQHRLASYGFILEGRLDQGSPKSSLQKLLLGLDSQPRSFGRRETLFNFIYYQIAMQIRKRFSF